jgi:hypothetical protein
MPVLPEFSQTIENIVFNLYNFYIGKHVTYVEQILMLYHFV